MRILGLGAAFPEGEIGQREAAVHARRLLPFTEEEARRLEALYRRSGVERRRSVLADGAGGVRLYEPATDRADRGPSTEARMAVYAESAGPLAARAAEEALGDAETPAEAITHLITVSCTGFAAPGVDAHLIETLGLSDVVQRTHVGFMGCHGALNGLRVARAFTSVDSGARVLLAAVELCSLHFHYGNESDKLVANALFGDGAAAAVAAPEGDGSTDA
jgi:predicted naringenin-chalcone synthase